MKTNVIIIDDHVLFNEGLGMILNESPDFEVIEQIYDSRMALHRCYALSPQLVLVDYNMPHMNGIEVVRELKKIPSLCKIVIISMYADNKDIELFEEVGIDGYLSKVTPSKELLSSLLKIISGEKVIRKSNEKKSIFEHDFFAWKQQLTKRELEIMKLLKKGQTSEQIASVLNLSYFTIETHRKNVNQKLKFKTKKEFYDFLDSIESA